MCRLPRIGFLFASLFSIASFVQAENLEAEVQDSPHSVLLADGALAATESYQLVAELKRGITSYQITNTSDQPMQIAEVTLHAWKHGLPGETAFYGEGYTMLSQSGGTLQAIKDLGGYTDRKHYHLPDLVGYRTVYGMLTLSPPAGGHRVIGFSSCRRFVGKMHVNQQQIKIAIACEGLTLAPGETWELEDLFVATGPNRNDLLLQLAGHLNNSHPRLPCEKLPTGWCSWYCYGPNITAEKIVSNLQVIKKQAPELRYIQIDDGYQPWMGDWLDTGNAFGGDVQEVLKTIRKQSCEPAIWVAPFVASPQSKLFKQHPEWFIQDGEGNPLRSDKVTFGGWRLGPWYMLDGTHPGAQKYLEEVFRTMRQQWGCTYFKLDANAWGAMPFGVHYDPKATSVEAYRQGMAAVRRGSGDAFLLGCNHPIWPSIGEVHGSRSSRDILRSWKIIRPLARENLMRNWQNQQLWWNDPDCLVLSGDLPAEEKSFHLVATYASGGMLLSSDDLTKLPEDKFAAIRKCATSPGVAAKFQSERLETGVIENDLGRFLVLLNWSDSPARRTFVLKKACQVTDFFTGEDLGVHRGELVLESLPGRSGRLLRLAPLPMEK